MNFIRISIFLFQEKELYETDIFFNTEIFYSYAAITITTQFYARKLFSEFQIIPAEKILPV